VERPAPSTYSTRYGGAKRRVYAGSSEGLGSGAATSVDPSVFAHLSSTSVEVEVDR
jgi:hypothetical protein